MRNYCGGSDCLWECEICQKHRNSKWTKANMAIMDEVDDVHKLHITIRTKKNYRPVRGFNLDVKDVKTDTDLKTILKYMLITQGVLWPVDEKTFNSFTSSIKDWKKLNKEAAEKVAELDQKYDLLVVYRGTNKILN